MVHMWMALALVAGGPTAASPRGAGSDLDMILTRLYATSMADYDDGSVCASATHLAAVTTTRTPPHAPFSLFLFIVAHHPCRCCGSRPEFMRTLTRMNTAMP